MKTIFKRLGFANNSSSSHSIILPADYEETNVSYEETEDFGWDEFVQRTPEGKARYLTMMLGFSIRDRLTEGPYLSCWEYEKGLQDVVLEVILKNMSSLPTIFKYLSEDQVKDLIKNGSIDHDSVFTFPSGVNGEVHLGLAEAFIKEVVEEDYIIHGGNDNGEKTYTFEEGQMGELVDIVYSQRENIYSVLTFDGSDFVLANRNGSEIRVSLSGERKKASFPSLVDISITNKCGFGCDFCYMGSTEKGEHADSSEVEKIINTMHSMGTHQFVLGGGEPTKYPHLIKVLMNTKRSKEFMFLSITTKNYNWYREETFAAATRYLNSVAISCNSAEEVKKAEKLVKALSLCNIEVSVQTIVGEVEPFYLRELLEQCITSGVRKVTFLGWKETNRGASGPKEDASSWMDLAFEYNAKHNLSIATDACLSGMYKEELLAEGIQETYLAAEEGMYSCFIDAVSKTIRKCSYEGEIFPIKYNKWGNWDHDNIKETFAKL